ARLAHTRPRTPEHTKHGCESRSDRLPRERDRATRRRRGTLDTLRVARAHRRRRRAAGPDARTQRVARVAAARALPPSLRHDVALDAFASTRSCDSLLK